MSRADFFAYLRDVHGSIARAEPGDVALYRQNHVRDAVAGVAGQSAYAVLPDRDNVTEVVFDDLPALFADLGRPYAREKIGPDGVNFSDLPSATALVGAISEEPVPNPGAGSAKVIAFVSAQEGVRLEDFTSAWAGARASVSPSVLEPVRSVSVQERQSAGDKVVGYFGGAEAPSYQGMLSLRFDDEATALVHAARYLDALGDVIDRSRSWHALVDEVIIYRR